MKPVPPITRTRILLTAAPTPWQDGKRLQNAFSRCDPDDHEFQVVRTVVPERVRLVQQDRHGVTLVNLGALAVYHRLAIALQYEIDLFDPGMAMRSLGGAW